MAHPLTKEQEKHLKSIPVRPSIRECAKESIDTDQFPAQRAAGALYHMLYDSLSAASHGDLRYALSIAWGREADLLESTLSDAVSAGIYLLTAAAVQLGFRADLGDFLKQHHFHTS